MRKPTAIFLLINFLMLGGAVSVASSVNAAKFVNDRPPLFTLEQEKYLAEHPKVYAYFYELYINQKTPKQIANEHQISHSENVQLLNDLATINIIQKRNKNDVNAPVIFLVKGTHRFKENGPLCKKFDEKIAKEIFDKVQADIKAEKSDMSTLGLWLSEEQHQAYLDELNELEKKYMKMSIHNKKNKIKDTHRVYGFMVLIPHWEPKMGM